MDINSKFIQIAAMPADVGSHPCGIFALDDAGTVWHYEGQWGWIPFTDERHASIDEARAKAKEPEDIKF